SVGRCLSTPAFRLTGLLASVALSRGLTFLGTFRGLTLGSFRGLTFGLIFLASADSLTFLGSTVLGLTFLGSGVLAFLGPSVLGLIFLASADSLTFLGSAVLDLTFPGSAVLGLIPSHMPLALAFSPAGASVGSTTFAHAMAFADGLRPFTPSA